MSEPAPARPASHPPLRIAVLHNLPSGGALRSLAAVLRALHPRHHVEVFIPEGAERRFLDIDGYVRATHVYPWRRSWPEPPGRLAAPLRVLSAYARMLSLWPVWR